MVKKYLRGLINRIYKILPLKESGYNTTPKYIHSLRKELTGFESLMAAINYDSRYGSVISVLKVFEDEFDELSPAYVKSEVFRLITLCNGIISKYAEEGDDEV